MFSNQDSIPLCIAGMLCCGSASGRLPTLLQPFPFLVRYTDVQYLFMPALTYLCCKFSRFSDSGFISLFCLVLCSVRWIAAIGKCRCCLQISHLWPRRPLPQILTETSYLSFWQCMNFGCFTLYDANSWLTACEKIVAPQCFFHVPTVPAGLGPALHFTGNNNNGTHKSAGTG